MSLIFSACATTSQKVTPQTDAQTTINLLQQKVDELETKVTALQQKLTDNQPQSKPMTVSKIDSEVIVHAAPAQKFKTRPAMRVNSDVLVNNEITDAFREGLILYEAQKYSDAIVTFSDFVKQYAQHPLAPRAEHWLAMGYYQEGEYKLADDEWNRLLLAYPNSSSVPEALAGVASCEQALGNTTTATQTEQILQNKFPHAHMKLMAKVETDAPKTEPHNTSTLDNGNAPVQKPVIPQVAPVNLDEGEPE